MTIPHRFDTPMTQPAARLWHPLSVSRVGLLALCAVSAGCGHSQPFAPQHEGIDQPFSPTVPIQLTFNQGHDRRAAWLPDGTAILYSTQLGGLGDRDICLAELPSTGGRQRSLTCNLTPNGPYLTEALEPAAPATDGRLVYLAATGSIGAVTPDRQDLVMATVSDPGAYVPILQVPYTLPGRRTHGGIGQIRWLGPNRLLYLGETVDVFTPCP